MIETLLEYDAELFLYLNKLGTSTWDGFWLAYTHKFNWIPFYLLLLYLLFKKFDKKVFILIILLVIAMVAFTDQITNLFKYVIAQRPRPCREASLIDEGMRMVAAHCGRYGFFSGHSSNSMAVAVFTGLMLKPYYKYLAFLLLFWAAIMAYSRIYVGVHYPLDIVCGMAFGALSGVLFYKLKIFLEKRFISW